MSYFFDVYGPFDIDREDGEISRAGQSMWDEVEDCEDGLARAWGCYMFCLQNGRNIVPWYVGKTCAAGGFREEAFADHKLWIYNSITERRGKRHLLLFPLTTGNSNGHKPFSKNRNKTSVIEWLERTLIGMALQRNPRLLNLRDTTLPKSVTVRGVMGTKSKGRKYEEVKYARAAFGLD